MTGEGRTGNLRPPAETLVLEKPGLQRTRMRMPRATVRVPSLGPAKAPRPAPSAAALCLCPCLGPQGAAVS